MEIPTLANQIGVPLKSIIDLKPNSTVILSQTYIKKINFDFADQVTIIFSAI